jgi:SAM-dependent methyltransferase
MRAFEDHFSRRSDIYAQNRPGYPKELYTFLASLVPHRRLAWDCGTGNGQAALDLAEYFDRVIATDASADQIAHASRHPRVDYKVTRSEASGLESRSTALVTAAVSVHWFDLDLFYAEVRRVLSPGGLLAVWCYSLPTTEPRIDLILERYFREILFGYWPERFRYVYEQYRTLPFPLKELTVPRMTMESNWNLAQLLGFLESWSGTANFEKEKGHSPVELIRADLRDVWGAESALRPLRWNLFIRLGQVS